jgi:hypothetical protein
MRISESQLRRLIRKVIKESEELGYGPPGSAINNPQIRGDIESARSSRRRNDEIEEEAREHYAIHGCHEAPLDPAVKLAWERICKENGEMTWDL